MQSLLFIKEAAALIRELNDFKVAKATILDYSEEQAQGAALQKRVGVLLGALQNPTLPSAYKLRDAAIEAGCAVDPQVLQKLKQYEFLKD